MPRRTERRSPALLRQHYEVEKKDSRIVSGMRRASSAARCTGRSTMSCTRGCRDTRRLGRKASPELSRTGLVVQLRLLRRYLRPETVVLEIGPGDCALSFALAEQVRQVYGLDVSETITQSLSLPSNFKLILSDGTSVPLPPESVDVAYSNQLMEHLHPDDALEQLEGIWRALRPGGVYLCITPNGLSGPHDISAHFDSSQPGFI